MAQSTTVMVEDSEVKWSRVEKSRAEYKWWKLYLTRLLMSTVQEKQARSARSSVIDG